MSDPIKTTADLPAYGSYVLLVMLVGSTFVAVVAAAAWVVHHV